MSTCWRVTTATAAARSAGTTASFAKELVRRAVLDAAVAGDELTDEHLRTALDNLLSDAEHLSRRLLGVGSEQGDASHLPRGVGPGGLGPAPRVRREATGETDGWVAYSPMAD